MVCLQRFWWSIISGHVDRHRGAYTFTSRAAKEKAAKKKREKHGKELAKCQYDRFDEVYQ